MDLALDNARQFIKSHGRKTVAPISAIDSVEVHISIGILSEAFLKYFENIISPMMQVEAEITNI